MASDAHATTQTVELTGSGERTVGYGSQTPAVEATAGYGSQTQPQESSVPRLGRRGMALGNYRLDALMGEGAMGSVWRATNLNLGKEVAVKLVKLAEAEPAAHERLRNEACLAAKINHSNVVTVFDTGVTSEGCYYLVMELLEGQDLGRFLEGRGKIPATEAVQILLPVLQGLDCAHKKKILHRDIKPENIFLARSEDRIVPKLVDFGIALAGDLPQSLRSTRVGALLGTPLYMSPEQARGDLALDERTDIWAIATVLYELIAGAPPFAAETLQALFFGIACHPHPALDASLCDSELAKILDRGLSKDPSARWSSARELGAALAKWLKGQGVSQDVSAHAVDAVWLSPSSPPGRTPVEEIPSAPNGLVGIGEPEPLANDHRLNDLENGSTIRWGKRPVLPGRAPFESDAAVEPLAATQRNAPPLKSWLQRRWLVAAFPVVAAIAYFAQGGEPAAVEARAATSGNDPSAREPVSHESFGDGEVHFPVVWRAPSHIAAEASSNDDRLARDRALAVSPTKTRPTPSGVAREGQQREATTKGADPKWGF